MIFTPNSTCLGDPSVKTPDPGPVRVADRLTAVVPFTSPAPPFNIPPNLFPGPSKLARLNRLNAETLGSKVKRSPSLSGQARVRSKLRSQLKPTLPGGADGMLGMVAPRACNCEVVSRLVATKSRPAGVSPPAKLLLKFRIVLFRLLAFIEPQNEPILPSGRMSP